MSIKLDLEFDCPQFVDFATELNRSSKDDVFFDCKDHHSPENENESPYCKDYRSPENENAYKSIPTTSKEECPSEIDENRLVEKMTAALSVIENTPKLKMNTVKGKHLAGAFINIYQSVKPAVKANTVPASNLHRSKSIARFNKIVTNYQNKLKGLGKRSSSLGDLRAHKKQTYAMTPMCLKRTIIKAKGKVIKSTEEMELEEIAKLQRQLREHLRHNEMTLKRLKLKPRPGVALKNTQVKTENLKGNKGLNPSMEKLNVAEKEPRKTIHALNHATMKNEAMKIENKFKGLSEAHKFTDNGQKDDKKSKHPSTVFGEVIEKNKVQSIRKTGRKIGFHSGLVFHDNSKKNTIVQPFSFDGKIREKVMSSAAEKNSDASLSNSTLKYKVDDGKENISYDKPQSSLRKMKGNQNTKCDIVKQLAMNKKIVEKHGRNPVRGLPLSENFARN